MAINPLNSLKPNFGRSLFGQLLGRGIFIFIFFLGTSEPDFSQAFREYQARSIPIRMSRW
jgi:hypothetical protein